MMWFTLPLIRPVGPPSPLRGKVRGPGSYSSSFIPQHFLYFLPLPQGQGSLRPGFLPFLTGYFFTVPSAPALSPVTLATRSRLTVEPTCTRARKIRRRVSSWMAAIMRSNIS